MPRARLRLNRAAEREVVEAFDWYFETSRELAEGFLNELSLALEQVAEAPERWPRYEGSTRRFVLRRFPYSLFYRELPDEIEVVAVAHQRRRPTYWQGR